MSSDTSTDQDDDRAAATPRCPLCRQTTVVQRGGRLEFLDGAVRCPVCDWGSTVNRMDCWGSAMWNRWANARRRYSQRIEGGDACE